MTAPDVPSLREAFGGTNVGTSGRHLISDEDAEEVLALLDEVERLRARTTNQAATEAALRAKVARVEALHAETDTERYGHNGHAREGEPECPGCWRLSIRAALDGDA